MDIQRILAAINAHRRQHGAADLQWDPSCAAAAQNWANRGYLVNEEDSGRFGESLAVSDTNFDAATECINAVNAWQVCMCVDYVFLPGRGCAGPFKFNCLPLRCCAPTSMNTHLLFVALK